MDETDIDFALLPPAVRAYRPRCPGCDPTVVVAQATRPCSYYDCPGLPEQLHVTCDTCMYDFAAEDGQVKCDHQTCETARRLAANVPIYRAWVAMLRSKLEATGGQ